MSVAFQEAFCNRFLRCCQNMSRECHTTIANYLLTGNITKQRIRKEREKVTNHTRSRNTVINILHKFTADARSEIAV